MAPDCLVSLILVLAFAFAACRLPLYFGLLEF